MLVASRRLVLSFVELFVLSKSSWLMRREEPSLWVMGRGQTMSKPSFVADSASFPFTTKPQFPFLWKTTPPFHHPCDYMSPGLHGTLGEIIKMSWLLEGLARGVYIPIHWEEAFSTLISSDFTANSTHRGGNQLVSKSTDVLLGGPKAINLRVRLGESTLIPTTIQVLHRAF